MIEVQIPLYDGRQGNLEDCIRGIDERTFGKIFWITASLVFEADGLAVHAFKMVPTMQAYEGIKELQIWDKRSQSVKKLVARIIVDTVTNNYTTFVEPYYRRRRLNATVHVHGNYVQPLHPVAFHNKTHHGDWVFNNTI